MRWTVIALICLAVASAKYVKKNRFGNFMKNFDDETEQDIQDWTDDDTSDEDDEDTEDEDMWTQQRHRHYQPSQHQRHRKQCTTCTDSKRRQTWIPRDDDDEYENQRQDYDRQRKHNRHHRREHVDDDEPQEPCHPNYDLLQNLDQINAQLAAKLHRETSLINDDKNTVVSPVAVQLALAAVGQGARGATERQINRLLDFGLSKNLNAHAALARILKGEAPNQHSDSKTISIKSTINVVLSQESAQKQFVDSIKNCFDGEVKRCDFRHQYQQCRDQINQWVAGKTSQKFQHALSLNDVSGNTKMISIGTMQLKTNWSKQFRKNLKTAQGQFYPLGEEKPTSVKVLQTEGDFNYFEDNQMQVLGVQTQEKQLTVYIILPKSKNGLNRVEKQRVQYGKQLQELLDDCDSRKQTLKVQLPVFQILHKMDTKQILRKLGVEQAFDADEADFSGVVENEADEEHLLKYGRRRTGGLEDIDTKKASQQHNQLHLNHLIQQATIQIDENGIDAASHSGKQKYSKFESQDANEEWKKQDEDQFKADHAFLFIVKHNPSNQLLLIGRVVDAVQQVENEKSDNGSD